MTTDFDHRLSATFDEIVGHTPDIGPTPSLIVQLGTAPGPRRSRAWLVYAASAIVVSAGGVLWATTAGDRAAAPASMLSVATTPLTPTDPAEQQRADDFVARDVLAQHREMRTQVGLDDADGPAPIAAAPWATDPVPVRGEDRPNPTGGPTLFPVLDSPPLDIRVLGASILYESVSLRAQTKAVVARVEDDGSMSELYTFVVGEGAVAYEDLGVVVDSTVPEVVELSGFRYAGWSVDGVPVVVMATDPLELLDDPAFSMRVGEDDRGNVTVTYPSLPPDFTELVAPQALARQAATARLRLIVPEAESDVGAVWAGLDNPLANTNLTEGTTITPTEVNERGAWIVSNAETDHRSVVFSPDDVSWLLVGWIGTEADLLDIAGAIEFTPADQIGAWMTRYDVTLPAIALDPTPS